MQDSLNFSKPGTLTSDEWVGRGFLLITYVTYVLSNASTLQDVISIEIKHGEFIFIALISLFFQPVRAMLAAMIALPIALIYISGGLWTYSLMVLVLALSLPIIWEGILSVVSRRDHQFLLILALIAFVPAVLSIQYLIDEGLFDITYGRPRMLLGYFHPKEAAISFAVPILLSMFMSRSASAVPWLLGATFIWLVGSRNIALMIFLAWALRWQRRLIIIVLPVLLFIFGLWLMLNEDWYGTIDNLMSLRLSVWVDVLNTRDILKGFDAESGDRFGADNFFVEAIVFSGPFALPFIFLWVLAINLLWRLRRKSSPWPLVCLIMLIFMASFDSGIASTGNIMHVLLWAIVLSPLFYHRQTQQTLFTSVNDTTRARIA